jgi:predicted esterase
VVDRPSLCAALAAALLALPAVAAAKPHHGARPRADLTVASGTVAPAKGKLAGSFVVRNGGSRRAGASTASLTAAARGRSVVVVKRFPLHALKRSATQRVTVSLAVPATLAPGTFDLRACADSGGAIRERSETNNCRTVGRLRITPTPVAPSPIGGGTPLAPTTTAGPPAGGPQPESKPAAPSCPPPTPSSQVPANTVSYTKDNVFTLSSCKGVYWIDVPSAYDGSHQTPTTLFVWLHGCGGSSSDDISSASPGGQDWISIAPGGAEGACWNPDADQDTVLAAIADVETHFNINRHRVILGGYSSGGDLGYRTIFYHSLLFAGILAENTAPFRDTGSTQQQSLAAASWKFNVIHLAHTEDDTYDIDTVRAETNAVKNAGFPLTRIERPGHHYDDDTNTSGTTYDMQHYLLPHIDDGWSSP